jgi:outer membrane protein TolC
MRARASRGLLAAIALLALARGARSDEPAPPSPPPAPRVPSLTSLRLSDALAMATARNLELAAGSLDPAIARERVLAEQGSFDTLLTAELSGGHRETPTTNTFIGHDVIEEDLFGADLRLSRRLANGGDLAVVFHADRLLTNSAIDSPNPRWVTTAAVEATQPLLRGAGSVALARVRKARIDACAADHEWAALTEDVLLRVEEAYWELAYAQERVAARRKAEDVAEDLLRIANSRLEARVGIPLDVAEARAGRESRRGDRIVAEGRRGAAQDALLALIAPFHSGHDPGVVVVTVDDPRAGAPPLPAGVSDEERWTAQALRARPDLLARRADLDALDVDVEVARSELRPRLDLVGRLSSDGMARGFLDAASDAGAGEAESATVGLRFSVDLGRRTAWANLRAAEHLRRRDAIRVREQENRIVAEVREALRQEATARAQAAAFAAEIQAASEALAGERDRQRLGESTPFRVLEKEDASTQAVVREGRAAADVRIARARLWKAVGLLARTDGVRVPSSCACR